MHVWALEGDRGKGDEKEASDRHAVPKSFHQSDRKSLGQGRSPLNLPADLSMATFAQQTQNSCGQDRKAHKA